MSFVSKLLFLWFPTPMCLLSEEPIGFHISAKRSNLSLTTIKKLNSLSDSRRISESELLPFNQNEPRCIGRDVILSGRVRISRDGTIHFDSGSLSETEESTQRIFWSAEGFRFRDRTELVENPIGTYTEGSTKVGEVEISGTITSGYDGSSIVPQGKFDLIESKFMGYSYIYPAIKGQTTKIPIMFLPAQTLEIDGKNKFLKASGLGDHGVMESLLVLSGLPVTSSSDSQFEVGVFESGKISKMKVISVFGVNVSTRRDRPYSFDVEQPIEIKDMNGNQFQLKPKISFKRIQVGLGG